jgi:sn-glycerol 3-phosphate transport system ATP-binding protein
MTLADKLIIMNGGHVEQIGRPAEVYNHPASRFVADFIGSPAMNLLEGEFDADGHFVHGKGGRLALSSAQRHARPGPQGGARYPTRGGEKRTEPGAAKRHSGVSSTMSRNWAAARLIHADVANGSRIVAVDTDTSDAPALRHAAPFQASRRRAARVSPPRTANASTIPKHDNRSDKR